MKTNSSKETTLAVSSTSPGKIARKLVRERAVQLAISQGRPAREVSKSDWEQAKLDLFGNPESARNNRGHIAVSESERWDPVPGSTGYKVHVPSGDDEDDEGRSDTERLVEEGVREAGRDQRIQASRDGQDNE
jgi:hypothetical protein